MKRIKQFLFLLIAFMPFYVKAYGVENYYIDAKVEENGDLLVQEYFNLNGTYNGFERIIEYKNDMLYDFDPDTASYGGSKIHNGDGLEILEVRAIDVNPNFKFGIVSGDLFSETSSASKGDYGVYKVTYNSNGKSLLIYNPSSYNKAFYIKYRIKNIAIRHNDVAEIGWNVVGNKFTESVGTLKVYLHFPGNTSDLRAWAHGPLNGNVSIVDKENIFVTISGLNSYTAIDVRATFDFGVINNSIKTTNVSALEKILRYEEDKAAQANYEREQLEKKKEATALEYLVEFENNITRYNYTKAGQYISYLSETDVKLEYLERLNIAKQKLDEIEKNDAIEWINITKEEPLYKNYEIAKEKVLITDNVKIRSELVDELLVLEKLVKENELNMEQSNSIFCVFLLLVSFVLGYIVYKKFVKNPKPMFTEEYIREIPSDYSPEIVSYLFHKKITDDALSAGILNLIRKKSIIAEKISDKNYRLKINSEYEGQTSNIEQKLIYIIFGNSYAVETKDLKKKAQSGYNAFIRRWESYHDVSEKEAKKELFYESDKSKKKKNNAIFSSNVIITLFAISCVFPPLFIALIIYLVCKFVKYIQVNFKDEERANYFKSKVLFTVLYIIISIVCIYKFFEILINQHYYNSSSFSYLLCTLLAFIFIILIYNKRKKTVKGVEEYQKWKALKNFLKDFGKFKDKEVLEINLWEQYLVYATLFGCSKKILEVMKLEFVNESDFEIYSELYLTNKIITSSIMKSYSYAHTAKVSASSSSGSGSGYSGGSFSSGSGGGGGFSSGGGSFGGGGGGGRF